ncbi:hypothetical protein TL16_g03055 [Triparma laevis f. inornata]|uniref:Uncharacterized protein n=1 Tax=Triparma laevis f. inornata TaxID=1714386 RepID=A0A9W6ZVJ6_9STRA|nr:hypothetical protein TL16_g03055 [Triparma laevis f. inornata]
MRLQIISILILGISIGTVSLIVTVPTLSRNIKSFPTNSGIARPLRQRGNFGTARFSQPPSSDPETAEPSPISLNEVVPSPSGVNVLPAWQQQSIFFACFGTLATSTYLLSAPLHSLFTYLPTSFFSIVWHPEGLGLIFILAGVSHFFVEEFKDIYPPRGAWGGLWQLPGSPEFHVNWTGVFEILGGLGFFLSISNHNPQLTSTFSALLLGLSIAVYPANLYMFTHGAELPKGIKMDNGGHAGRFITQLVLCAVLGGLI